LSVGEATTRGRSAYERRDWADAYEAFSQARALDADDVERLAMAASLSGQEGTAIDACGRWHELGLEAGDQQRAAPAAFWAAMRAFGPPSSADTTST
jgi:hypothetical protein